MKILALYREDTLSLLRRIRAPFSVLTERGDSFSLLQVDSFTAGMAYGADVTVLQNWELTTDEIMTLRSVATTRIFVADCSDPELLVQEEYRRQLESVQLVTVPNERLKREVGVLNTNVAVIPSCIDIPYMMQANREKLAKDRPPVMSCLGPYDWELVDEALHEIKAHSPKVVIAAGSEAFPLLQDIATEVPVSVRTLPLLMHATTIGLCPTNGEHAWDTIWEDEYGIFCRPALALQTLEKSTWVETIRDLLKDAKKRADLGNAAFERANAHRSTKIASIVRDTYRKRLPHLLLK